MRTPVGSPDGCVLSVGRLQPADGNAGYALQRFGGGFVRKGTDIGRSDRIDEGIGVLLDALRSRKRIAYADHDDVVRCVAGSGIAGFAATGRRLLSLRGCRCYRIRLALIRVFRSRLLVGRDTLRLRPHCSLPRASAPQAIRRSKTWYFSCGFPSFSLSLERCFSCSSGGMPDTIKVFFCITLHVFAQNPAQGKQKISCTNTGFITELS